MGADPTDDARPPLQVQVRTPDRESEGTVLYVHGTLDSSAIFVRRTAAQLPRWTAVTYDRRGWGSARRNGHCACSLTKHVADLQQVLTAHAPDIVVGHSYGGLLALNAIAGNPTSVRALVVYEPPVRWLPWWPDEAPWEALVRQAGGDNPARATTDLREAVVGEGSQRTTGNPREIDQEDGRSLLTEMNDPELNTVGFEPLDFETPLLAAAGANSLEHHRRTTRKLADLVVHGTYVEIPGAAHVAHVSAPEAFFALVTRASALTHDVGSLSNQLRTGNRGVEKEPVRRGGCT